MNFAYFEGCVCKVIPCEDLSNVIADVLDVLGATEVQVIVVEREVSFDRV